MTSLHGLTLTFTHRGRAILQHAVQWTDATGRTWTAQPGLLKIGRAHV